MGQESNTNTNTKSISKIQRRSERSIEPSSWIVVGKIGATHGLNGWVRVHSFTENPYDLLSYPEWGLDLNSQDDFIWHKIPEIKTHNNKHFLAKFPEINSPEQAQKLVNLEIVIARENLPKLEAKNNEWYWHDIVGMTVISADSAGANANSIDSADSENYKKNHKNYGIVKRLLSTGANDVLELDHWTIPFIYDLTITKVCMETRQIFVIDDYCCEKS